MRNDVYKSQTTAVIVNGNPQDASVQLVYLLALQTDKYSEAIFTKQLQPVGVEVFANKVVIANYCGLGV